MVHLPNVKHDEHSHDNRRGTLQRIADVGSIRIGGRIWQAATDDPQTHQGVKNDRNENESPFQNHDRRIAQRVDFVDLVLIHRRSSQHRGIHRQVHHNVGADWNQARQRK
jgi:hypothetical protein